MQKPQRVRLRVLPPKQQELCPNSIIKTCIVNGPFGDENQTFSRNSSVVSFLSTWAMWARSASRET